MEPAETQVSYNLGLARAMAAELKAYLVSPHPDWPLENTAPPGQTPYPRLTLGNLQLTLDRLVAHEPALDPRRSADLQRLRSELDRVRRVHAAALQRKAQAELRRRLRLWGEFLRDLREGSATAADYAHEVRNRVIAARLGEWAASPSAAGAMLESAAVSDRQLRGVFKPGPFVWDPTLQTVYPAPEFWFLYGGPR